MDINEELNKIIFKYHLDRHYPHYRNMYMAEKILHKLIDEIIQDNREVVFIGDDKTGIAFVRNMSRNNMNIHFVYYDQNDESLIQLEDVDWKKYEEVYLISFLGTEQVERWFRQHDIHYEWIYDVFEREGLYLQRIFYVFGKEDLHELVLPGYKQGPRLGTGITESIQCELYCQRSKYEKAGNVITKRIALEKCIFLALYMRNFVAAKVYVLELLDSFKECQYIADLWKEVLKLLEDIKAKIKKRQERDIILYWIDAIPYGDEADMSYLQSIKQKSVVFENAFTYVPNTHPTMRAMLLGKKDIDDQVYHVSKITQDNSPVIRFLEKQGYGIEVFSNYFKNENFPWKYLSDHFYMYPYETISEKIWDMLSKMFCDKEKKLRIVHIMDAHVPCMHSRMRDENYNIFDERYRLARIEIDEQLAFYDAFISKSTFRIYMSDHGRPGNTIHDEGKLRHHVLFNIYNYALEPKKITELFSLLDFGTVIKQIILENKIDEKAFARKYVEIGQLDWYNPVLIERMCRNKDGLFIRYFGYKGIVDKEYIYVRYKFGKEWLQKRDNIPEDNPTLFFDSDLDICDLSLLTKYRKLVGGYPEHMEEDEQFKYSKYLYAIYHNVLKHNEVARRVDLINQILIQYPVGSVGIRMGGKHSEMLYACLTRKNKEKIWGFIDKNKECRCSKLDLPIVDPEQISGIKEMKAICLSTFDFLDMLREEAKTYLPDIDVVDIYSYFEKNEITCKGNFWEPYILKEDYEVGFPFTKTIK